MFVVHLLQHFVMLSTNPEQNRYI